MTENWQNRVEHTINLKFIDKTREEKKALKPESKSLIQEIIKILTISNNFACICTI